MTRMTFPRALRSELQRLARSPLAVAHAACALAAGLACGAYFATAPWDARLGADAYVQFLGALMPLMAGVVSVNAFFAIFANALSPFSPMQFHRSHQRAFTTFG